MFLTKKWLALKYNVAIFYQFVKLQVSYVYRTILYNINVVQSKSIYDRKETYFTHISPHEAEYVGPPNQSRSMGVSESDC